MEENVSKPGESAVSRRNLFQIVAAAPAVAALAGSQTAVAGAMHSHGAAAVAAPPFKRQTFDDAQWKTVHVLCDWIIPADERSGSATQAGVPEFIDDWLAFRSQEDATDRLRAEILGGLTWLDRESNRLFQADFAAATKDQQKQIIDRVAWPAKTTSDDRIWAAFFSEFRDLTVGGFFSSKMGVADLPYLGNTAVVEWKGCDPKVWKTIEERMDNGYKGLAANVRS